MAKAVRTWSWRGWLPDISAAIDRFPAPIAFAVLFTLYELYHGSNLNEPKLRSLGALAACFLWTGAVDLFVESTGRKRGERIALSAAGVLVIALMFWLAWSIWLSPYLLIGGILLLVGLAGFPGPERSSSAFWLFNQRLWLGAALAAIAGVLVLPIQQAHYLMGLDALLLSFMVVIIGGLGSLKGTLAAAFMIGLTDGLVSVFFTPTLARIVASVFVALVLVFRTGGLYGEGAA